METFPSIGDSMPENIRSKVDFPEADRSTSKMIPKSLLQALLDVDGYAGVDCNEDDASTSGSSTEK